MRVFLFFIGVIMLLVSIFYAWINISYGEGWDVSWIPLILQAIFALGLMTPASMKCMTIGHFDPKGEMKQE